MVVQEVDLDASVHEQTSGGPEIRKNAVLRLTWSYIVHGSVAACY